MEQNKIDDEIGFVKGKGEKVFDESNSDAVVSSAVMVGDELLESKNGTVTIERSSEIKDGGDTVVQDSVDDGRVSGDERMVEKVLDQSSSDGVVLSVPSSNPGIGVSNGVEVGADLLDLKTGTLSMQPISNNDGGGGIAVCDPIDEKEIEMENAEKVLDESSSDALVTSVPPTNCNIAASNEFEVRSNMLESNTVSQIREPSVGIAVRGSVNDIRGSVDEKEIAMENIVKVLNEDAEVLSVPLSHSDISASNMVKIGAESLDSKTGTLMKEPSSDRIEGGGIAVQDQIDDARVSGDLKEIVSDENVANDEEEEGKYKVTDLVWAKVKNYPWWPGQIFDPSASTDKAKKFSNKKGFLIAYFGDQSFAWNKASNIKPFRKNFHKMEKQGKSKAFYHAVNCALDEVSRRIDFGLTCSCLSKEVYNNIKSQVFVNAGIKKEASEIEGGDNFSTVSTFKPANIVQSVQDLAREHFDGIGRLEVLSVRTQILAYFRWKGYNQFSTQFLCGLDDKLEDKSELSLMEEDKVVEDAKPASVSAKVSSKKRKSYALDTGDLVLSDKSEDDSELSLMEEDKVAEDEKPISVSASVSSKKMKLNASEDEKPISVSAKVSSEKKKLNACDSGDSVPRKKEKGLKNVMLKGKSTGKSRSKKNSVDSGDSALDDTLEDESELPLTEDDKVVEDAKPTSERAKVSSKRKKLNASDSGDLVSRKKEKLLKNVTQKENSSVKDKSKKNSDKKVTLADSGFKKESRNTTDDRNLSNSPPKKLFRIGDTICRIAKQLSESPSILKKESMKSKNDELSVKQPEPPSIHKKKSKKSKNDEKCIEQTQSPSILKKESKKSKNDEKSVEETDTASILEKESKKSKDDEKSLEQSDPPILKKESMKSKTDEKCVEQTQSPSILKKKSKKSKNDEKCVEPVESPSVVKKESKKSKNDEKRFEQTESPSILEKESEKSKNDEMCVEQSKENSKTSKESSATALILKFTNADSIPSLTKLNEIFRRYGTVRETDTEILQKNCWGKVVFEEKSDAETAFSSAGKFSIFGPSLISYRLDYSPTLRKIYTRNRKRNRKDRKSDETNQSEDEAA